MSDVDPTATELDAAKSKLIGTAIALVATVFEGGSYIVSKKGLQRSVEVPGQPSSANHAYLKNWVWWVGTGMNGIAQGLNFVALLFASPVLVAPLGALSVVNGCLSSLLLILTQQIDPHPYLHRAIFARIFLRERLGRSAVYCCTMCIVGAMIIFLNAPAQLELSSIDDAVAHVLAPGFLSYVIFVLVYIVVNLKFIAPRWGTETPLVYVSICSFVGSLTVTSVACFGVGVAQKEFNRAPTWFFLASVVVCILTQLNFFNKALDLFPTTVINATTYVGFACLTIVAQAILLGGFESSTGTQNVTLIAGLYITCLGVVMLSEAPIKVLAKGGAHMPIEDGDSEAGVLLGTPPALEVPTFVVEDVDTSPKSRHDSFDFHHSDDEEAQMLGGNYDTKKTRVD